MTVLTFPKFMSPPRIGFEYMIVAFRYAKGSFCGAKTDTPFRGAKGDLRNSAFVFMRIVVVLTYRCYSRVENWSEHCDPDLNLLSAHSFHAFRFPKFRWRTTGRDFVVPVAKGNQVKPICR